ncbi:VWA domain-containing protein [Thiomonas intermedia]|uniref:VWA domain-containing protein n=1 Tax=Thiomonas intermedia TaxID=926 RepID=UPI0009A555BD|nr:VWA domain-containing protein [Thiomonas intermedia]
MSLHPDASFVAWLGELVWAQPLAFVLLPLAALPLVAAWRGRVQTDPVGLQWLHPDLQGLLQARAPTRRALWAPVLHALAIVALVLALAQPQRLGGWIAAAPEGRDIVVLLDTSLTMGLHDVQWNGKPASRLAVAQRVFADFAQARRGDRFALVAFGSHAATLLPPTFDARAAGQMAGLLAVGQLGPDTALGDAIALALRQVSRPPAGQGDLAEARATVERLQPIIILYTDGGVSNAGQISPADAVALARHLGVRIYTVEVGTAPDAGQPYTVPAYAGPQPDLRLIAQATGGRFYFAASAGAQQTAVRDIGALNPRLHPPPTRRAVQPLYIVPLLLGVVLLLLAAIGPGALRRLHRRGRAEVAGHVAEAADAARRTAP